MKQRSNEQAEAEQRAREYIDQVAAVNRRHGMGNKIPKAQYDRAVKQAARVFRGART